MKKIIKRTKLGASLSALAFSLMVSTNVQAQSCTVPPTCSELGYTRSASECATVALKCPFDQSKYYCLTASELEAIVPTPSNCAIGDILYSDKTCNANVVASKTPIGVVFDVTNRLAIALKEDYKAWSDEIFDIPDLINKTSTSEVAADWQGKSNTLTVLAYCTANGKSCPAFEYVNSYTTAGTKAGDWYLPAGGELNAIYSNMDVLNTALSKVNGSSLASTEYYWTSTEKDNYGAWYRSSETNFSTYYQISSLKGKWYCRTKAVEAVIIEGTPNSCIDKIYVRPVLAF